MGVDENKGKKVFLQTFGCQMNVLDSELMLGKLQAKGFEETPEPKNADVILYNTCAIREKAEHKVLSMMGDHGRLKSDNPTLQIGVLGCMSQLQGNELFKKSQNVNFVVGTDHLDRIDEIVEENLESPSKRKYLERREKLDFDRDVSLRPTPFQAYVSVMRGCDLYCTYCVVPTTRGRERSRVMTEILDEVKALADEGVSEITYLGQTVNAWGRRFDEKKTFSQLLRETNKISGIKRIRYVTSHPSFMSDDLIDTMAECEKVCAGLHLPVQSGSSAVLKKMKRGYTREEYLDIIQKLKHKVPNIALATDIILGFCGETDADFEDTVSLMKEVEYQQAFIFKYSVRPGTYASTKLPDDVPVEVKKERNQILLKVQEEIQAKNNKKRIGQEYEVLIEKQDSKGVSLMGRDETHLNIAVASNDRFLIGEYVNCKIVDATSLTLRAELVNNNA